MSEQDYDVRAPGWGAGEEPDLVTKGKRGKTALWFKPKSAKPPEKYDVCVPHRNRKNWVVYILFLGPVICVVLALLTNLL